MGRACIEVSAVRIHSNTTKEQVLEKELTGQSSQSLHFLSLKFLVYIIETANLPVKIYLNSSVYFLLALLQLACFATYCPQAILTSSSQKVPNGSITAVSVTH